MTQRNKPKEGKKQAAGRVVGATALATIDRRGEAVRLFLAGLSVADIAQQLNRSERSVQLYLADTRLQLIAAKKEHFDQKLTLHLDDAFEVLAANTALLSNRQWLETTEPARISEISKAYGIVSDKVFVMLAAGQRAQTNAPPASCRTEAELRAEAEKLLAEYMGACDGDAARARAFFQEDAPELFTRLPA